MSTPTPWYWPIRKIYLRAKMSLKTRRCFWCEEMAHDVRDLSEENEELRLMLAKALQDRVVRLQTVRAVGVGVVYQ
jgi:hypothetical protein